MNILLIDVDDETESPPSWEVRDNVQTYTTDVNIGRSQLTLNEMSPP